LVFIESSIKITDELKGDTEDWLQAEGYRNFFQLCSNLYTFRDLVPHLVPKMAATNLPWQIEKYNGDYIFFE